MRRSPRWLLAVAVSLLAALPGIPSAQGEFIDVLPLQDTAVTAVAWRGDDVVAGHGNGRVLLVDGDSLENQWSSRPSTARVTGIAVAQETVVVGYLNGVLAGLSASTGQPQWTREFPAGVSDVATDGETALATFLQGDAHVVSLFDGATAQQRSFGGLLYGADHDGDWLVTGTRGTWRLDGTLLDVVASDQAGRRVAGLGDAVAVVDLDGAMHRVDDGAVTATYAGDFHLTTVAVMGEDVLAGDDDARVHVLGHDLERRFEPLATYAVGVHDIAAGPRAAVAFDGGWVGRLPPVDGPVALMFAPQELAFVPAQARVSFAYAHPAGGPGYFVSYAVEVRAPGATDWQEANTGVLAADPLTRLHTADLDLGVFPAGALVELRLAMTDRMGRTFTDGLAHPVAVDPEAPRAVGKPQLSHVADGREVFLEDGSIVPSRAPIVSVGHEDALSGVVPEWTRAHIDGQPAEVLEASFRFTRITADLADGSHDWRVQVFDKAGNAATFTGTVVTDTKAPEIAGAAAEAVGTVALTAQAATDEPATCAARTTPGASLDDSPRGTRHAFFLDGLSPQTAYTVHVTCRDDAGREAQVQATATTLPGDPDAPRPDLRLTADPPPPAAGDWMASPPTLSATSSMDGAVVHWSLDGGPFGTAVPDIGEGEHTVAAFAAGPQGGVSQRQTLALRVDLTPPPAPYATWAEASRSVRWDSAEDATSGIDAYLVEGRRSAGGPWVTVSEVAAPGHRHDGVPSDIVHLRVVARDLAGWTAASDVIEVGKTQELARSLAFVQASQLARDEHVAVRLLLAQHERFETAVLVDGTGVHHPFSDRVLISRGLHEVRAPASAFDPGAYRVLVRVHDGERPRDLDAGSLTLLPGDDGAAASQGDDSVARRDTPWPLAAAIVALAIAVRRRVGG